MRRVASFRDGHRDTGNFRLAAVTLPHHRHHHRGAIPVTLIIEIAVGVPSNHLDPLASPSSSQSPRPRSRTSLERFRCLFHHAASAYPPLTDNLSPLPLPLPRFLVRRKSLGLTSPRNSLETTLA